MLHLGNDPEKRNRGMQLKNDIFDNQYNSIEGGQL